MNGSWRIWRALVLVLVALAWGVRLLVVPHRYFDPDEFQHLHTGYCIAHGLLPYRDFYEHHTPWLAYLLSWVYSIWGDSTATIFAARYLMAVFAAGVVAFTYLVGKRLFGADAGLLGALLLSFTLSFLEKTLEIRPDVPATLCLVAGLYAALRALGADGREGRWVIAAGLALGCACLFTQKALFAVAGIGLVLAWTWIGRRASRSWRPAALFAAGLAAPGLATVAYFAARGGLEAFVDFNFLMNARWKARFGPGVFARRILEDDPFVAVLGIAGFVAALPGMGRGAAGEREPGGRGATVLLAMAAGAALGLFVLPVPFLQAFQPLLPPACILTGGLMWSWTSTPRRCALLLVACLVVGGTLGRSFARADDAMHLWAWGALALAAPAARIPTGWQRALAVGALLAAAFLATPLRALGPVFLIPALVLTLGAALLPARAQFLNLLLVGMLAFPLREMVRHARRATNAELLREIAYVLETTDADDAVLTGWRGSAAFRPHAYFYPFLHAELQMMLSDAQRGADVVEALERVRPELVEYDRAVRALEPVVQDYVRRNYRPTGVGVFWRRRPDGEAGR